MPIFAKLHDVITLPLSCFSTHYPVKGVFPTIIFSILNHRPTKTRNHEKHLAVSHFDVLLFQ